MTRSVLIPITNVYAKGDYTAAVKVGHNEQVANLILDTGSSTLVVQSEDYDPANDQQLQPTQYAQNITYGAGGWYGPVVQTKVMMGNSLHNAILSDAHIAIAVKEQQQSFGDADGIFGLAYHELNRGYDLTEYLESNNVEPPHTYPWVLAKDQQDDSIKEFKSFIRQYPHTDIKPYFTQLEEQEVVGNQFAFIIHRSSIYQTDEPKEIHELKKHPLNNGLFVMGHPKFHCKLYKGQFKEVKVVDDKYYNTHLIKMRVGDGEAVIAPPLEEKYVKGYRSNSFIDSGVAINVLPEFLWQKMCDGLIAHNSKFEAILENFKIYDGKEKGIDINLVNLEDWPPIYFIFEGVNGEEIELVMHPETYWQTHAPEPNQISFQFVVLPGWPNQSLFGLPLMNNYFTIFDRQEQMNGVILFAEKPFNPHKLPKTLHENIDKLKVLFKQHLDIN